MNLVDHDLTEYQIDHSDTDVVMTARTPGADKSGIIVFTHTRNALI